MLINPSLMPKCGKCMFFAEDPKAPLNPQGRVGMCRRMPPSVVPTPRGLATMFPPIQANSLSCGEFKQEEDT